MSDPTRAPATPTTTTTVRTATPTGPAAAAILYTNAGDSIPANNPAAFDLTSSFRIVLEVVTNQLLPSRPAHGPFGKDLFGPNPPVGYFPLFSEPLPSSGGRTNAAGECGDATTDANETTEDDAFADPTDDPRLTTLIIDHYTMEEVPVPPPSLDGPAITVHVDDHDAAHDRAAPTRRTSPTTRPRSESPTPRGRFEPTHQGTAQIACGILHLYRESPPPSPSSSRPAHTVIHTASTNLLCILAVPMYMTPADFLTWLGPIHAVHISHLRMIRDHLPHRYMVLARFRDAAGARACFTERNGRAFHAFEPQLCSIVKVTAVEFAATAAPPVAFPHDVLLLGPAAAAATTTNHDAGTTATMGVGTAQTATGAVVDLHELPSCPVCLERMDAATTGILTILCQHTFHCGCLRRWEGASCPVCRYMQPSAAVQLRASSRSPPLPMAAVSPSPGPAIRPPPPLQGERNAGPVPVAQRPDTVPPRARAAADSGVSEQGKGKEVARSAPAPTVPGESRLLRNLDECALEDLEQELAQLQLELAGENAGYWDENADLVSAADVDVPPTPPSASRSTRDEQWHEGSADHDHDNDEQPSGNGTNHADGDDDAFSDVSATDNDQPAHSVPAADDQLAAPAAACRQCGSQDHLWACLICGHIGCGRYAGGHARQHYARTAHLYAIDLATQRVWDYVRDTYVHRLIQNTADGKLVEVAPPPPPALAALAAASSAAASSAGAASSSAVMPPPGYVLLSEADIHRINKEYTWLLQSQLDAQRQVLAVRAARLATCAQRLQDRATAARHVAGRMRKAMDRIQRDLDDERALSSALQNTAQELRGDVQARDAKVADLEEQIRDLTFFIECREKIEKASVETQEELAGGQLVVQEAPAASGSSSRGGRGKGKGRMIGGKRRG
ncbi:hypothetical protein AMAG_03743 [Allomyces macrogynus ATCC 38327]|uniref:RING-type domain-containing protein n=1 Tax=Allomyces macrogynus (strain ATCC 38327) TaxID=578462 RepID=A0A0L0SAQ8_ALLM3|nr:hypothetical protein AMAG_03743 [Allomyces macrogynus ATCC 38327]|eukprot:KNE59465.1 hypothetical protein AMAG_03743 [Allomyces macrogynus ATCC 38327]